MVNIEDIHVNDYENRITEEDIDHIIRLLNEYSEKLRKACDELNKKPSPVFPLRRVFYIVSLFSTSLVVTILIGRYFRQICYVSTCSSFPEIPLDEGRQGMIILMFLPLSISFFLWLLWNRSSLLLKLENPDSHGRKMTMSKTINLLARHDADSLAKRLLEMVRLASPAYEYIETKRIKKIELALKIAEAESILEYHEATIDNLLKNK